MALRLAHLVASFPPMAYPLPENINMQLSGQIIIPDMFISKCTRPKKPEELLQSKADFEDFVACHGVTIQSIWADNGVYKAKFIQDSCKYHQKNLSYCTFGAHWQNGVAKHCIGTFVQCARTLLLHAMSKWPDVITEDFWPFALCYMALFHNSSI